MASPIHTPPPVCSICLELVVIKCKSRGITQLKCGHTFHSECIYWAFNAKKGIMQCPYCRDVECSYWVFPGPTTDDAIAPSVRPVSEGDVLGVERTNALFHEELMPAGGAFMAPEPPPEEVMNFVGLVPSVINQGWPTAISRYSADPLELTLAFRTGYNNSPRPPHEEMMNFAGTADDGIIFADPLELTLATGTFTERTSYPNTPAGPLMEEVNFLGRDGATGALEAEPHIAHLP